MEPAQRQDNTRCASLMRATGSEMQVAKFAEVYQNLNLERQQRPYSNKSRGYVQQLTVDKISNLHMFVETVVGVGIWLVGILVLVLTDQLNFVKADPGLSILWTTMGWLMVPMVAAVHVKMGKSPGQILEQNQQQLTSQQIEQALFDEMVQEGDCYQLVTEAVNDQVIIAVNEKQTTLSQKTFAAEESEAIAEYYNEQASWVEQQNQRMRALWYQQVGEQLEEVQAAFEKQHRLKEIEQESQVFLKQLATGRKNV